jgi:hypothetical protein
MPKRQFCIMLSHCAIECLHLHHEQPMLSSMIEESFKITSLHGQRVVTDTTDMLIPQIAISLTCKHVDYL